MRTLGILLAFATLAACTELPDVAEPPDSANADYPPLVPLGDLEVDTAQQDADALREEQIIAARVASLKARAARLRSADVN